jgi:hypothetical protein
LKEVIIDADKDDIRRLGQRSTHLEEGIRNSVLKFITPVWQKEDDSQQNASEVKKQSGAQLQLRTPTQRRYI